MSAAAVSAARAYIFSLVLFTYLFTNTKFEAYLLSTVSLLNVFFCISLTVSKVKHVSNVGLPFQILLGSYYVSRGKV